MLGILQILIIKKTLNYQSDIFYNSTLFADLAVLESTLCNCNLLP